MRCIHCGKPLPVDSKFCQYCGEILPQAKEQSSEAAETAVITEEKEAVSVTETREVLNTEPQKPISLNDQKHRAEKKSRKKASAVIPWVLFLLTAICTVFLLIHAVQIQNQTKEQQAKIAGLQTQIDDLENTVARQKSVIEDQTAKISTQREEHAEEKKKAENEAKKHDKKQKIIDLAEKTAKECIKKISEGMSTYKHISKSMESLLTEIDSKDQIDMFND